jgi:hypothetical protein
LLQKIGTDCSNKATQKFDMEKFNLKTLHEEEDEAQQQVKIYNRFTALKN